MVWILVLMTFLLNSVNTFRGNYTKTPLKWMNEMLTYICYSAGVPVDRDLKIKFIMNSNEFCSESYIYFWFNAKTKYN